VKKVNDMDNETQNTQELETKLANFVEFETKYRIEPQVLTQFKELLDNTEGLKKFIYVEGPDVYYTKAEGFARYRKASHGLDNNRAEVTLKVKPVGAKNNIIRKEVNWRVDETPKEAIAEGLMEMGFKFNFSIWKSCHIYNLEDATLVFYTVYDTTDGKSPKTDNFIEIEVCEELAPTLSESEAWQIIVKYEKLLEPLGITPQKRLRKSLFEMYKREDKS